MTAPLLSIVVPIFNEEECLPLLRAELARVAEQLEQTGEARVEIVLVDDGSTDGSWGAIARFADEDPHVHAVSLSRNFGQQSALTCGYQLAAGDAVVTLDADLQDPLDIIHSLVAAWRRGADIVYAVRRRRDGETRFKRWSADLFYRALERIGNTPAPRDAGDYRLMSRRAVDALNEMPEVHRYVRGMVGWLGFRTEVVPYERQPRAAGRTKYSARRMMQLAASAVLSFSTAPLRLAYGAALLGMALALAATLSASGDGPGAWSLHVSIAVFGCLNLICLGILGEYVGRIYEQSKRRPQFLVREQRENPVAPPQIRLVRHRARTGPTV